MGSVYTGTHAGHGNKVAVKVLASSLACDDEFVSRFYQEAKLVTEIGHSNIVEVIDFVITEVPHRVAYVMELIDGAPLGAVLQQRRLRPPRATRPTPE